MIEEERRVSEGYGQVGKKDNLVFKQSNGRVIN